MAVSMENIGVAAKELVRKETEAVRESQVLQQDENKIAVEKEKVVPKEEYRSVSEDGDTLKVSKDGEELEDARVIAKEDKAEQRTARNNEEIRADEVKKEAIAKEEEAKRERAEYEQALKQAEQERKERQQEIREEAKEAEEKRSEIVAKNQNTNSNEKQQTTNNKENVQIEMVDKAMVDDINRRVKRANET